MATMGQLGGVVKKVVEKSLDEQMKPVMGEQENILHEIREIREYMEGPLEARLGDMTQMKRDVTSMKQDIEKIREWIEDAIARNAFVEIAATLKQ